MRVFIDKEEIYPVFIVHEMAGYYDNICDIPTAVLDRHRASMKAFNDSQEELAEWLVKSKKEFKGGPGNESTRLNRGGD